MSASPIEKRLVVEHDNDEEHEPKESLTGKKAEHGATEKEPNSSSASTVPIVPIQDEQRLPPVPFYKLFQYSTKLDLALNFIGLIAALASGAAQPLMTLLFGQLTNGFVGFGTAVINAMRPGAGVAEKEALQQAAARFRHDASMDSLYLVIIGIGMVFCTYIWMLIWTWTGETNAKRIREHYLKAILRQDIAYFDYIGPGEVATRIQSDTHLVQLGTAEKVALIAVCLGAFVTGFGLAYAQSWKLALAMTSIFPCIAMSGGIMTSQTAVHTLLMPATHLFVDLYTITQLTNEYTRLISRIKTAQLDHIAAGGTLAEEGLSTIRTAKAFGAQKALSDLYNVHINKSYLLDLRLSVVMGIGMSIVFGVIYCSYALAFSFGTTLILSGEANAGKIVNVVFAIVIASFSAAQLPTLIEAIANARGAASRLFATIDRVPPIDSANPGGLRPGKVEGTITLEKVRFNYPARPDVPVFKSLSITFAAGKTSALVGASGSGKSTIVSLIERFYDPLSGSIRLDENDLRNLNLRWLRSQIGLVSQEPVLFATTIRGNVEHGLIGHALEHATPEEKFAVVKAACAQANADDFISKLPSGYDTMVGERGFLLSGGQKQRIAIARAIVSDPSILLLDEATSALDTQSEGIVQNALDKASRGRTTITIAHRLSTIKDADVIYVMGSGEVLESGTHQELLRDPNGPYAKLVQAQRLRDAERRDATEVVADEAIDDDLSIQKQKEANALENAAAQGEPLGRTHTERSLASEILEERHKTYDHTAQRQYTLYESLRRMAILNRHSQKYYYIGAVAAMATGMVYPCYGIIFSKGIAGFQLSGHELRVTGDRNALWFFILAICAIISISAQNYTFLRAAAGISEVLRKLSFKTMLRQDVAFFDEDKNSTGALTMKLSDNPERIRGLAGLTLGSIVQAVFTVIGGSIVGLAYGWKLALIGIACIPFVIGTGYIRLQVIRLKDVTNKRLHEDSARLACEAAGAIRTVASLTREDDCYREYSQSLEIPLRKSNRSSIWSTSAFAISQAMSFFVIALIFWEGSRLVASLEYDTFTFFVVMMTVTFGGIQAGNIFSYAPDISESGRASDDILNLLDNEIEIDSEATDGESITKVVGKIEFRDVHFRYPTRPAVRVLRGFNLTVEPGTHIALVGQSGCGKSTIIQLVERFYDPLHGTVNIDGRDTSKLNVQEYRKHVALVSQEPTLYSGTIKFNILLGATRAVDQVTQEELEEACRNANILDFIKSLPQGFDTEVGGKGSQLSGGQKQRVAIARALLRNPSVLLLDEATSALDSNSERVVQQALDVAAKGRTTISVAHRLSTIQGCDMIHFVYEGQIVESGTHDELMKLGGHYAEFVALQDLSHQ